MQASDCRRHAESVRVHISMPNKQLTHVQFKFMLIKTIGNKCILCVVCSVVAAAILTSTHYYRHCANAIATRHL